MTTIPTGQQNLAPSRGQEKWRMNLNSVVFLEVLGRDRYNNNIARELKIGPSREGYEFVISTSDRVANQSAVVDEAFDPFRNGTFTRTDADQQLDPNTRSEQAITDEDILAMLDLSIEDLEARVSSYGEVPIRRILAVATAMDASHQKISMLETLIQDRYLTSKPQASLTSDEGEKLS